MVDTAFSKLSPSQLVMIGQRDLDVPEQNYIENSNITVIGPDEFSLEGVISTIKSKGINNIYVHIDLDVLDCDEFPYVMVPAPSGLKTEQLSELLAQLKRGFHIVGLSLLEYISSEKKEIRILSDIIRMGEGL